MRDLDRDLGVIAVELAYPPTPPLAAAVQRELGVVPDRARPHRPRHAPHRRPLRVAVIAAVVVLLLAATAVAASRAVREFLGLQGATVERVPGELPTRPPAREPDLGVRVPLATAERAAGFGVLVPGRVGAPDDVRLRRQTPGAEVALLYEPRRGLPRSERTGLGLLVTEFRGDMNPQYLRKIAGQATVVERLTVGGQRAIWIEGAPHLFFYSGPDGRFVVRPLRLAANVLLIERGDLLVRLEGEFGRDAAVRLGESLR